MLLTGTEDLRVQKTIEGIKNSFEKLICEKDYEKITVKELCEKARINKKTFYHYYPMLDGLLHELQEEFSSTYIKLVKDYKLPDDLGEVNRCFFEFSAKQGLAYEKITCSGSYSFIRQQMINHVMAETWGESERFVSLAREKRNILMTFVNSTIVDIYRQWVADGKQIPLQDIIEFSNRLLCGGVRSCFEQKTNGE